MCLGLVGWSLCLSFHCVGQNLTCAVRQSSVSTRCQCLRVSGRSQRAESSPILHNGKIMPVSRALPARSGGSPLGPRLGELCLIALVGVLGQPGIYTEFQSSLSYRTRLYLKNKKKEKILYFDCWIIYLYKLMLHMSYGLPS